MVAVRGALLPSLPPVQQQQHQQQNLQQQQYYYQQQQQQQQLQQQLQQLQCAGLADRGGDAALRAGPSSNGQAVAQEDVAVDLSEVYFLVMHFLSHGPCQKAFTVLWNELLQHKLLPRRYHALYSKLGGSVTQDENDDGMSYPLNYSALVQRNPHIENDHLVKLLQQLLVNNARTAVGLEQSPSRIPLAANVPTLIGSGAFSLLDSERSKPPVRAPRWMTQSHWPRSHGNQVHGLMLREISGGFSGCRRSSSSTNYTLLDPPMLVKRITAQKTLRGHRNAVYCAIFDRKGQLVITGSDDRLVKIWSAISGLCLRGCRGHEGDITDLAVSCCNTKVASGSNDCTIRVWRLPDGYPICVLRGHQKPVTQIQFSPQQKNHLLSSSDEGICRIWNVATLASRQYVPRPDKDAGVKMISTPPPGAPVSNQIVCCAFNGDGSLFVTGGSDKCARVWEAPTVDVFQVDSNAFHELDRLDGHANEVNYVQFSGCAAVGKTLTAINLKEIKEAEDPWFTDSIVTCSRDGSAIIWTPRRHRQVMKDRKKPRERKDVKLWKKTYHLRVPNPPLPPQPSRGGGARQRVSTPRGVNMIVWSLDNRFVLALMDCRICVWNPVNGTLVHCLTGHTEKTFVLDVHPFDPRIAMSAGYDGRVIIWDIWKGSSITQFETGDYQLVDGNFSPDGTSLVVSDEVGQMHLFAIGDEETTWKDGKYDQFFLGDFRPLMRDSFGNVLDQETQLPPEERNIQDLLCDASMIPYPDPYQTLYQHRRLGAIGMVWEPPAVMLAVGMTDDGIIAGEGIAAQPQRRASRVADPQVFIDDVVDWEPEAAASSEDGSDYSVSDDRESQDDAESLRSLDNEEEAVDTEDEVQLRRSRRNKRKAEDTVCTSVRRKLRRKSRNKVVEFPYEKHYERRSGQGRQSRSTVAGTSSAGATKQDAPRSKRKAAKRALRLFKNISDDDDDNGNDNDNEDEDDNENGVENDDEEIENQDVNANGNEPVSVAGDGMDHSTRNLRRAQKADELQGELAARLLRNKGKQKEESDAQEESEGQDLALKQNMSEFGEFCRVTKPRSQRRRLVLKLKPKSAGSGQDAMKMGLEGDSDLKEEAAVADTWGQPSTQASSTLPKLIFKHPRSSSDLKEALLSNDVLVTADLNENALTLNSTDVCDMDEANAGLAQDEKRKFEWKKGQAAKRVRLGSSSGEADAASMADEFPAWSDQRQAGNVSGWNGIAVNSNDVQDDAHNASFISRSPSNSDDPRVPAAARLRWRNAAVSTNLRRRARNLLLPDSEDESQGAHVVAESSGDGEAGDKTKSGGSLHANGVARDREVGNYSSEYKSSSPPRHSPNHEPEAGSSASDVGKNSKLTNGIRVRLRSFSQGNHVGAQGTDSDSGQQMQGANGHANGDESGAEACESTYNSANGQEDEEDSPVESSRRVEVDEEHSGEEGEREQEVQEEDEDEAEGECDDEDNENDSEYKCGASGHVNESVGWPKGSARDENCGSASDAMGASASASEDDVASASEDNGYSDPDFHGASGQHLKVGRAAPRNGLSRQNGKRRKQRSEGFAAETNHTEAENKVRTRRMTMLLSGSQHAARASMRISDNQNEQKRRGRVEQRQRLKGTNRDSSLLHVDTEPIVQNIGDGTRVGRRTSARTRHAAGQYLNGRQDVGHVPEQHGRGVRKMRKREDAWLLSTKEEGSRYVPQFNDEVVYFRQGHEAFLDGCNDEFFRRAERPWIVSGGVFNAVELCQIVGLDYTLHPDLEETHCRLLMKFIDPMSEVLGDTFQVILPDPDMKSFPDFIVEKHRYEASIKKPWATRDHCQVWWANPGEKGTGGWWKGRITRIKPRSIDFPDSPWEKYEVQYRPVGKPEDVTHHSPWELYESSQKADGGPPPQLDGPRPRLHPITREQLMDAFQTFDYDDEDEYGLQEAEGLILQPSFVNKTALPLSIVVVRSRLRDDYYHGLEQFKHDLDTYINNAVTYVGEASVLPEKLKRLRKYINKAISKAAYRS